MKQNQNKTKPEKNVYVRKTNNVRKKKLQKQKYMYQIQR